MIIVLGAGCKAEHLCYLFNLWGDVTQFYEAPRHIGETKHGKPVTDEIIPVDGRLIVYSSVGDTRDKRRLIEQFKEEAKNKGIRYEWGELIHRTSVITNPLHIGDDFTIREFSSIGSQCKIGDHVSIGPLANISHNTIVEDYSTICGQAAISGGVYIGEGVFIGQGASIKPNAGIGCGAVVGTGAVVVKDVAPNLVVGGNPAGDNAKFRKVPQW